MGGLLRFSLKLQNLHISLAHQNLSPFVVYWYDSECMECFAVYSNCFIHPKGHIPVPGREAS